MQEQYLLGLDVGSSFIKAALVDARSRRAVALAQAPEAELNISAPQPGWAEQDPRDWWECCIAAVRALEAQAPGKLDHVCAAGIAYQMHGLVLLDAQGGPLRPAIIWCDSRAAGLGDEAARTLGVQWCLRHLQNTPGNFTGARLAWVKRHEPEIFAKARWAMLPGDYIALKLTGTAHTTAGGLSEMVLWDYEAGRVSLEALEALGLDAGLLPPLAPALGDQGRVTPAAAQLLHVPAGIPLAYRAGDQPNNALALGALEPGEAVATAGTSGVVYAVAQRAQADPRQRVNTFLHASHTADAPRLGVLLCINGAGSAYRWLRQALGVDAQLSYQALNALAEQAPPGAEGLAFLPFGNGAERLFANRTPGAVLDGLDFNRHSPAHLARAVLEGVACAMAYGVEAMRGLGLELDWLRAGAANMFLSSVFAQALAAAGGLALELRRTDGATGAALAAGCGAGVYPSLHHAVSQGARALVEAGSLEREQYAVPYARWRALLASKLEALEENDG